MPDSEKITINLSVVDLGRIDLLVDEGFYASRSDFIRSAIRKQLEHHASALEQTVSRKLMVVGVTGLNRAELERRRANGERLSVRVVGMLQIADDVTPELAREVLEQVVVRGVLRAPEAVKAALAERLG